MTSIACSIFIISSKHPYYNDLRRCSERANERFAESAEIRLHLTVAAQADCSITVSMILHLSRLRAIVSSFRPSHSRAKRQLRLSLSHAHALASPVMSGISFKIAAPPRPSSSASTPRGSAPPPRPSSRNHRAQQPEDESDSDDEDGLAARARKKRDELVTGFDKEGVTKYVLLPAPSERKQRGEADSNRSSQPYRKHKEVKAAPLVIPSLPNKDWRKAAEEAGARRNGGGRKKREMYIPDAVGGMRVGGPAVGDGTQGNMGTRDTINSEPIVGGLALGSKKEEVATAGEDGALAMEVEEEVTTTVKEEKAPETEEQRALRELMAGNASTTDQAPSVEIIHSAADARGSLGDAVDSSASTFQRDVHSRPDEASLDDYSRVPVGEFGAAMLRGMGWKPGQAASRNGRKGPTEAFVPKARPAMLGIGAKPMADVLGPAEKGKGPQKSRREELKFMPLLKREREGSASGSGRDVSLPSSLFLLGGSLILPLRLALFANLQTPAIANSPHASTRPPSGMSSRLPSASPPPSRPSSARPVASDSYSSSRDDRDRRGDREGSSYRRSRDDDDRRRERDDRDRGGSSRREGEDRYSSSARRRDERDDGYRSSSKRERSPGRDGGKESSRRRSRSPAGKGERERDQGSSTRRRSRSPRRDDRRRDDDRDRRR